MKHAVALGQALSPDILKMGPFTAKPSKAKADASKPEAVQRNASPEEFSNLLNEMSAPREQEPKPEPQTGPLPLIGSSKHENPVEPPSFTRFPDEVTFPNDNVMRSETSQQQDRHALNSLNIKPASHSEVRRPRPIEFETAARVEFLIAAPVRQRTLTLPLPDEPDTASSVASEKYQGNHGEEATPQEKSDPALVCPALPIALPPVQVIKTELQIESESGEPTLKKQSGECKEAGLQVDGDDRQALEASPRATDRRYEQGERHESRNHAPFVTPIDSERPATMATRVETSFAPPSSPPPIIQFASQIIEAVQPARHANRALPMRMPPQDDVIKTLRFSLRPEHLGSISVAMRMRGGALELKVEVETSEAHARLIEDQATLKQVLADAGYAVSEASIILISVSDQATPQRLPQDARSFDQSAMSNRSFDGGQSNQRQEGGDARTWRTDKSGHAGMDRSEDEPAGRSNGMFL